MYIVLSTTDNVYVLLPAQTLVEGCAGGVKTPELAPYIKFLTLGTCLEGQLLQNSKVTSQVPTVMSYLIIFWKVLTEPLEFLSL